MKHLRSINQKAGRIEQHVTDQQRVSTNEAGHKEALDVVALGSEGAPGGQAPPQQPDRPHIPLGCSLVFSPGWEADANGGTAGLCQPVERDLFDCHLGCFWPAHVPDQLNHAPDWTGKCAAAQKDWRKIDLIFP